MQKLANFFQFTRGTFLFIFAITVCTCATCRADDPPNIVFIFIDDMGFADPSCFGNPHVKTPNIDRLADEGIKLTNFYVNSPICSPSRVAVTTGNYPARWKIHSFLNSRAGNKNRGMANYLSAAAPTTAKKLQQAGYATAHFGKWHMGGGRDVDDAPLPQDYGFDESLVAFEGLGDRLLDNPKNKSAQLGRGEVSFCKRWEKTEKYTDRAIDFIQRNKDKPFYVRLFPNDVHDAHVPWPGREEQWKSVTSNPWEQKFFPVLEEMDKQIGRLISEIDRLKLAERTLIVFTSDNGPTDWPKYYRDGSGGPPGFTGPFFGRKWSLFEGGIRMPFLARWIGTIPAGRTDDSSVMSGIDLSPTFCQFAGVKISATEKIDGVDRSSVLLGQPSARPALFWQYGAPHAVLQPGLPEFQSPSFAMRDGNWKLLANPDGSEARLFDLVKDPGEKSNLLVDQPQRAAEMSAKIAAWAKDVGVEYNAAAKLVPPAPMIAVAINNHNVLFKNHHVKQQDEALRFDGTGWLDLAKFRAPKIAGGRWIKIRATVQSTKPNGVVVAHGGDKEGYSIYLDNNHLCFATCANWKRTVVRADTQFGSESHAIEAFWQTTGEMLLKVDNKLVARGKSPTTLAAQPGDSLQVGADLIKPVGSYEIPNRFTGVISNLQIGHRR